MKQFKNEKQMVLQPDNFDQLNDVGVRFKQIQNLDFFENGLTDLKI